MPTELRRQILGRTNFEITQLGYGTALPELSSEEHSEQYANELLNAVLDAGINFVDTAPDYALAPRLSHCDRRHRQARSPGGEYPLCSHWSAVAQGLRTGQRTIGKKRRST